MLCHKLFYGQPAGEGTRAGATKLCVILDERPYYVRVHKAKQGQNKYEVDMSLLGCNARVLWHEIYTTIIEADIPAKNGVIVCKEFQEIHAELHDIFYSYMQENKIAFHIYTSSVSFIKDSIREACKYTSLSLPTTTTENTNHVVICQRIVAAMDSIFKAKKKATTAETPYLVLREALYDVLVYHVDVGRVVWYLVRHCLENTGHHKQILHETMMFFKYYNNYFRPIHHLERLCFRLWSLDNV
jgi:hypothetical protein